MTIVQSKAGAVRGNRGGVLRGISRLRRAALPDMARAFAEGVRLGGGRWWAELGKLNRAEQDLVRRKVAERVTYLCASPAVLIEAAHRRARR